MAAPQTQRNAQTDKAPYFNATLEFSYVPPGQMRDKTERFRAEIRRRAEIAGTHDALVGLLALSPGGNDAAADWGSVTIESYPRSAVPDQDDSKAEAKMSAWVAHSQEAHSVAQHIVSGQTFEIFVFGAQQGAVRKGGIIWTTIRKGQLLSFAFAANSPEQLQKVTESIKTVQFF